MSVAVLVTPVRVATPLLLRHSRADRRAVQIERHRLARDRTLVVELVNVAVKVAVPLTVAVAPTALSIVEAWLTTRLPIATLE